MSTLKRLAESLAWVRTINMAAARGIEVRRTDLGGTVSYTVHTASGDQVGRVFGTARDLQDAISRAFPVGGRLGRLRPRRLA